MYKYSMGLKSIWDNNYYKNIFRPVPKWAFALNFGDDALKEILTDDFTSIYSVNALTRLNDSIVSINYGKREISVINTFFAGLQANFPGRVQNTGELTITFNESADFAVTSILENIFSNTSHNQSFFKNGDNYRINDIYAAEDDKKINRLSKTSTHPLVVEIYDPSKSKDIAVAKYEFYNVFLIAINEETVDYNSEDEIITKTARFSYDYMEYHTPKEDYYNAAFAYADEELKKAQEEGERLARADMATKAAQAAARLQAAMDAQVASRAQAPMLAAAQAASDQSKYYAEMADRQPSRSPRTAANEAMAMAHERELQRDAAAIKRVEKWIRTNVRPDGTAEVDYKTMGISNDELMRWQRSVGIEKPAPNYGKQSSKAAAKLLKEWGFEE